MEIALCLLLVIGVSAGPMPDEIPAAEPEFLNKLLEEKRYDEFNYLMDINIPSLSHPREESNTNDARFNKALERGDIVFTSKQIEQARQGIRFEKYRGSKWQNGVVPIAISSQFSPRETRFIHQSLENWNRRVPCIKMKNRTNEVDYVLFINGDGCWSYIGKRGKQQSLSIAKNGCMSQSTIHHEMQHALGISHEQNRYDRDDNIKMLWDNIPEDWKSQYEKNDPEVFGLQSNYDYYSNMHYPVNAPGTNKPAFEVKDKSIDQKKIGNGKGLTDTDVVKIRMLYCN